VLLSTWSYNEKSDTLQVNFHGDDSIKDQQQDLITRLSWKDCKESLACHDFFGRRPRTRYDPAQDELIISFPPYNIVQFDDPLIEHEMDTPVRTILTTNTRHIRQVHIENASNCLVWEHLRDATTALLE
jgi:hypothetical protein